MPWSAIGADQRVSEVHPKASTEHGRISVSRRTFPPTTALASIGANSNVALARHVAIKAAALLPLLSRRWAGCPSAAHRMTVGAARRATSTLQPFVALFLFSASPLAQEEGIACRAVRAFIPSVRRRTGKLSCCSDP